MRLTVLGCWAPYPRAGGACSGYLVRAGDVNIMLDAGNGAFSNLCKNIDFRQLDILVLSHLHPDHYVDLFAMQHAMDWAVKTNSRPGPLKVYMPGEPPDIFSVFKGKGGLEINSYDQLPREKEQGLDLRLLDHEGVLLRFLAVPHSLPGYAVSIKGDRGTIVYTGDCSPNEELVTLAAGAGIYLSEGTGLDRDAGYLAGAHHTARQAGVAARRACVKRLVLTHFWPEHPVEKLVQQAGEGFGKTVEPAVENNSYEL